MNYTKKEIKLYEQLAEIKLIHKKGLSKDFFDIVMKGFKRGTLKTQMDFMDKLLKLDNSLKEIKVPKKFMIIKSLEDKK